MPYRARIFWAVVCLAGIIIAAYGAWTWKLEEPAKFLAYLVTAALASQLKVQLPEINGTISINFLFILVGVVELNFGETLALACVAITIQCFNPLRRRPNMEQLAFNVASVAVAVWVTYFV